MTGQPKAQRRGLDVVLVGLTSDAEHCVGDPVKLTFLRGRQDYLASYMRAADRPRGVVVEVLRAVPQESVPAEAHERQQWHWFVPSSFIAGRHGAPPPPLSAYGRTALYVAAVELGPLRRFMQKYGLKLSLGELSKDTPSSEQLGPIATRIVFADGTERLIRGGSAGEASVVGNPARRAAESDEAPFRAAGEFGRWASRVTDWTRLAASVSATVARLTREELSALPGVDDVAEMSDAAIQRHLLSPPEVRSRANLYDEVIRPVIRRREGLRGAQGLIDACFVRLERAIMTSAFAFDLPGRDARWTEANRRQWRASLADLYRSIVGDMSRALRLTGKYPRSSASHATLSTFWSEYQRTIKEMTTMRTSATTDYRDNPASGLPFPIVYTAVGVLTKGKGPGKVRRVTGAEMSRAIRIATSQRQKLGHIEVGSREVTKLGRTWERALRRDEPLDGILKIETEWERLVELARAGREKERPADGTKKAPSLRRRVTAALMASGLPRAVRVRAPGKGFRTHGFVLDSVGTKVEVRYSGLATRGEGARLASAAIARYRKVLSYDFRVSPGQTERTLVIAAKSTAARDAKKRAKRHVTVVCLPRVVLIKPKSAPKNAAPMKRDFMAAAAEARGAMKYGRRSPTIVDIGRFIHPAPSVSVAWGDEDDAPPSGSMSRLIGRGAAAASASLRHAGYEVTRTSEDR